MNLFEYVGKFHPLIIHLPIGILTLFIVLGFIIPRKQLQESYKIIGLIILVSALSATFSCISGFVLSRSGEYEAVLTANHRNMGIALMLINWIIFFMFKKLLNSKLWIYYSTLVAIALATVITGHLGGSLTHGSDFITPPKPADWFSTSDLQSQITINSTAFESASLIFEEKCVMCHGENKQKGDLRLDTKEGLLKGGEEGALLASNGMESLLLKRILLPLDDDEHMPPSEKKQLTPMEIGFLSWWVKNGADFDRTLAELNFPDSLQGFISPVETSKINKLVPLEEVAPADPKILEKLISLNVLFSPVAMNSNYLSVSFMNVLPEDLTPAVEECIKLNQQIVWLNLDYQNPDLQVWKQLGALTNMRKLSAKNSNLNDEIIAFLQPLDSLVYLNLVGNEVSSSGFEKIKSLQNLESVYLYQTNIDPTGFKQIEQIFPNATIDSGNYIVPILASDTTVFKGKR